MEKKNKVMKNEKQKEAHSQAQTQEDTTICHHPFEELEDGISPG